MTAVLPSARKTPTADETAGVANLAIRSTIAACPESSPKPLNALGVPPEETAVANRDARHALIAIGMWEDPADDEVEIAWVREFARSLQPFSSGGFYPNYETDVADVPLMSAYGPDKYERLVQVKQKYDPTNVFRLNQNIRPAV